MKNENREATKEIFKIFLADQIIFLDKEDGYCDTTKAHIKMGDSLVENGFTEQCQIERLLQEAESTSNKQESIQMRDKALKKLHLANPADLDLDLITFQLINNDLVKDSISLAIRKANTVFQF